MERPKIVILGGGYGGLITVITLQKRLKIEEAEIVLVNNHHYHYITTKLHESAAGSLKEKSIKITLSTLLDRRKVKLIEDTVESINKEQKKVILQKEILNYDYLVIALGGEPETFHNTGIKEYAHTIWNLESAQRLRIQMDKNFNAYVNNFDNSYLTIVVGGGGFTGVEYICELAEQLPSICHKYGISKEMIKIICVEASSEILSGFDEEIIIYVKKILADMGVELILNMPVKKCDSDGVLLANGEKILAKTVVFTGGIKANSILENARFQKYKGRIRITPYLEALDHSNIFIIGDCSVFIDSNGINYPPTAQIAIQQGVHCGKNIIRKIHHKPFTPFVPIYRGMIMSLGRKNAVGIVYGKKVKGRFAAYLKKVIEWRYYLKLGGISLLIKKIWI